MFPRLSTRRPLEKSLATCLDYLLAFVRTPFDRSGPAQALCFPPTRTSYALDLIRNISPRSLEYGASFSFELTGNRGAMLATKYRTYREDALSESELEDYIKRHYNYWVAFAHHKRCRDDTQPVLLSGFDMTKDFAMVAYSNESVSGEPDLTIATPMVASASAFVWGTWHSRCSPHTN